jgi:hypothetical protein
MRDARIAALTIAEEPPRQVYGLHGPRGTIGDPVFRVTFEVELPSLALAYSLAKALREFIAE